MFGKDFIIEQIEEIKKEFKNNKPLVANMEAAICAIGEKERNNFVARNQQDIINYLKLKICNDLRIFYEELLEKDHEEIIMASEEISLKRSIVNYFKTGIINEKMILELMDVVKGNASTVDYLYVKVSNDLSVENEVAIILEKIYR